MSYLDSPLLIKIKCVELVGDKLHVIADAGSCFDSLRVSFLSHVKVSKQEGRRLLC